MKKAVKNPRRRDGERKREEYAFRLFVAGDEPNSKDAQRNLQKLCDKHLEGRHTIDIIDVLEDFQTALDSGVLVTPTLIVDAPFTSITVLGNLRDTRSVLSTLRLGGNQS